LEQVRNRRSFYLVALLIRAKKSLNERDNSVMEFIVPAWPHKPWWCRLRGLNHVRTLQLNEDYPWVEPCAYSAAERGLFRKIDAIVSFFMDLFTWKQPIAPPPFGPARSTGACRRWPREWVYAPAWPFGHALARRHRKKRVAAEYGLSLCRYCCSVLARRREGHWTYNPVRLLTARRRAYR
jgi:hypothetical protein